MDLKANQENRPPTSYLKTQDPKYQFQGGFPHLFPQSTSPSTFSPFFKFPDSPASPDPAPTPIQVDETRFKPVEDSCLDRFQRLSLFPDDSEVSDSRQNLATRKAISEPSKLWNQTPERRFKVTYATDKKRVSDVGVLRVLPCAGLLELLTPSGVRVTSRKTPPNFTLDPGSSNELGKFSVEIKGETFKPVFNPTPKPEVLLLDSGVCVPDFLTSKLRPHQREGVVFMYQCISRMRENVSGCILADSMGLGKTLQVISLVFTLVKKDLCRSVIIAMPATLLGNWVAEFQKWLQGRLEPVIYGRTKQAITAHKFRNGEISVLLISYEMLKNHASELRSACDLLICDEGHKLKNSSNATSKELDSIPCKRRILVTGTPLQNNLKEFHACIKFANQDFQYPTWPDFDASFARPIRDGHKPGASEHAQLEAQERNQALQEITSAFILRRTSQLMKELLPPRHEFLVFLPLTEAQEVVYLKCLETAHCGRMLNEDTLAKKDVMGWAFALISRLRKVVNHPQILLQASTLSGELTNELNSLHLNWHSPDLSNKLVFLDALLKLTLPIGDKTLITSSSKETLSLLEDYCSHEGISYIRMDGETKSDTRLRLVNDFNKSYTTQVFLLSIKTGGCGLNLVGANRMVLFDPDWNPSIDKQAMGRVWRDGQTKEVFIYRLFSSGTLEEKIHQLQAQKEDLFASVVDAQKSTLKFTKEQLKQIFTYTRMCETYSDSGDLETFHGSFLKELKHLVEVVKEQKEDWVAEEPIDFGRMEGEKRDKGETVQESFEY